MTDEDTPLVIDSAELLMNDIDAELPDHLVISNVASRSYLGATVVLAGNLASISYDPTTSTNLDALARNEYRLDSFQIMVSDRIGSTVTTLVAVAVVGRDDSPVAVGDTRRVLENTIAILGATNGVLINDIELDIDGLLPDNLKTLIQVTNQSTVLPGVWVTITNNVVAYNPSTSVYLEGLAVGQTATDAVPYTLVDGSFVFANQDYFRVLANSSNLVLDVMANDRNYSRLSEVMRIVSVSAASEGGSCVMGAGATNLVYTPQPGFIGDEMVTYFIDDGRGNSDRAQVLIRVTVDRLNGVLQATRDRFSVARGTTSLLDVRGNDNVLPELGSNLFVHGFAMLPDMGGHAVVSNNAVAYTPAPGYGGAYPYTEQFECIISGGSVSLSTSLVEVLVVNRYGSLVVHDDRFNVAGDSVENGLDVLRNDDILPGLPVTTIISSVTGVVHGAVTLGSGGRMLVYTPQPGFVGQEVLTCAMTDQVGGTGTATVTIVVGDLIG
jgi:VCBS repeat-containing protein